MQPVYCAIIDDDPISCALLHQLIINESWLELTSILNGTEEALSFFKLHKNIDLLFLDIDLNGESGISLLKNLPYRPHVIFTTSHEDFAFIAYELEAIDFLKKPVNQLRFERALKKFLLINEAKSSSASEVNKQHEHLFFKSGKNFVKINLNEVLFFEACKDYVKTVTQTGSHLTLITLSDIEKRVDGSNFIRLGKSFIANKSKITKFDGSSVSVNQYLLPVSRKLKNQIKKLLGL